MKNVTVSVRNLSSSLILPKYETEFSAGMDVMACFDCGCPVKGYDWFGRELSDFEPSPGQTVVLNPNERILIPTGLKVEIPEGYEIQVRPRSGLALKKGITVLNTPGTVDSDYRGMIGIILINHSNEQFEINHGDRIAQIVLKKVERIHWNPVSDLSETQRGEGGFGSTGVAQASLDSDRVVDEAFNKRRTPSFQVGDQLDNVGLITKVYIEEGSGQIIYDVDVDGEINHMSEQEILDIVL